MAFSSARRTGYALRMRTISVRRFGCVVVLLGLVVGLPVGSSRAAARTDPGSVNQLADEAGIAERLEGIIENIPSIPAETKLRRSLAHARFCLPQNALGILYYGFLQATGRVLHTRGMNEATIVVTESPVAAGASLGRYLFVPASCLTEFAVRHEYGHVMQGYRHGPFYLLFEGVASFLQAAISMVSPSFAAGYFDRWPEDEANELGGVP